MVPTLRLVLLSCIVVLARLDTQRADATKIVPIPFEQLVTRADFVGIVECEEAGGIVARYKVIESWKGPKAGERLTIRMATNYWGQQFDIALCGERFLVTAYRQPPDRIASWTVGGDVPLWWREIPVDYQLPLLQGRWHDTGSPAFAKTCKAARDLLPIEQPPVKDKELERLIEENRLLDEIAKNVARTNKEPTTEAEMAKWRKDFAAGPGTEEFGNACNGLTRHDPGVVVEYLLAWKNPNKEWHDADHGYVIGSLFAYQCGKDRKKHLTALLGAKDPYIRVAGAVYLCFEDLDAGKAELKKLTALEGDPGVWAALTLASRGDKDAVPRALEVFELLPQERLAPGIDKPSSHHENLRKRVLVLLSNSARAGGVPQPPRLSVRGNGRLEAALAWWKEHGDKVVLTDPWLKILEKQKID
jgi:hypothetical protein